VSVPQHDSARASSTQQEEINKSLVERAVAEGASVVSIHRAEAEKVAGGRISVRVFALFVIDEGKIALCDELTRLEHGAAEDRDLGSRR
jgi:hypothetical protein